MDKAPNRLPGDLNPAQAVARALRVDQAGEIGAVRIYQGQLAVLGKRAIAKDIRKMAEQERRHLERLDRLVEERRIRPTLLSPLWNAAGFALGAATALMGEKAAMACTVAVEEVIDRHYAGQVANLAEDEADLRATLEELRAEEIEHRDLGLAHGAEQAPGYALLSAVIRTGCRAAIWLAERI